MTRDAEMTRHRLRRRWCWRGIGTETDAFGVSRIPGYAAHGGQHLLRTRPTATALQGDAGRAGCASCSRPPSRAATTSWPSPARSPRAAHSDAGARPTSTGLLDGSLGARRASTVDTDLRWALLTGAGPRRPRRRRPDRRRSSRATTPSPARSTPPRRGPSRPTAEAKAEAWDDAIDARRRAQRDPARRSCSPSTRRGQEDVLAPYVEKYLAAADTMWEEKGTQQRLDGAGVHVPAAAGLAGAARPRSTRGSRRRTRQPGREALRPRGPRRRGPRPRRPGQATPRPDAESHDRDRR